MQSQVAASHLGLGLVRRLPLFKALTDWSPALVMASFMRIEGTWILRSAGALILLVPSFHMQGLLGLSGFEPSANSPNASFSVLQCNLGTLCVWC